jgi:hypothetical protein
MKYLKPILGWYMFLLGVRSLYLFNDLLTALSLAILGLAVLTHNENGKYDIAELAYLLDSDSFNNLPVTKKILVLNKLGEALSVMRKYTGRVK